MGQTTWEKYFWVYSVPAPAKLKKNCRMYNDTRLVIETLTADKTGILEVTANCHLVSLNLKLFPHSSGKIYTSDEPNDDVIPDVGKYIKSLPTSKRDKIMR